MDKYITYVPDMEPFILTNWYYPEQKDRSGYANGKPLRHDAWCEFEKKSYEESGKRVEIVKNDVGQLALIIIAQEGSKDEIQN